MTTINPLSSIYDVLRKLNDFVKYNTPVGSVKQYAGNTAPLGWLLCVGQDVLIEDYSDLYDVLGTTYGIPNDSAYFRLPNFAGRVPVGHNDPELYNNELSSRTLGDMDGEEVHVLSSAEIPSHTHGASTNTTGAHTHGGSTGTDGSHTHTHNCNGGSPGLSLCTYSGSNTMNDGVNTGEEPDLYASSVALTIASAGSHSHTISSDGNHSHTVSVTNTGGGNSHNIMQPYTVIHYIIKYSHNYVSLLSTTYEDV